MENREISLEILPVAPGFYNVRAFDGEQVIEDEYEETGLQQMSVADFLEFYRNKLKENEVMKEDWR